MNDIKEIRFIDLFSGIGGFRLGLERTDGYRCIWSNDFNKYANRVYAARFSEENHHTGDIRGVDVSDIPNHDLLCGGFPCQAFSTAGKRLGFKETRGTLFFEICRIAESKRPRMLLLENVKGLLSHDGGRTFGVILNALEDLGYWWEYQTLNSKYFGVPQNRERVFIVGHLRGSGEREIFPITENGEVPIREEETQTAGALSGGGHSGGLHSDMTIIVEHKKITERSGEYGTGFKENEAFCLDSSSGRDQVIHLDNDRYRRFTPVECERLQGFPDGWTAELSDTQRYKCLGNAVTVNVIEFLGQRILDSWG